MALTGLIDRIYNATLAIDFGRKGFATKGKAEEGRTSYEKGIALAMTAFQEAQAASDPQTFILAEYTFITQEFQLSDKSEKETIESLTKAIDIFKDAILALKAVEKPGYKTADETYPHNPKYRVKGFPRDSYHVACNGHKTRLQNILKTPGLDLIERALLKQRRANMTTAQKAYLEKQRKIISNK